MDIILAIISACIMGMALGYVISTHKSNKKPIGTLRVDSSDPDGPYLFLELATDTNALAKEKYVLLKVDTRSYISQK